MSSFEKISKWYWDLEIAAQECVIFLVWFLYNFDYHGNEATILFRRIF